MSNIGTDFSLRLPEVLVINPAEIGIYALSFICGYLLTLTLGVIPALAILGLFFIYNVAIPKMNRL